MSFEQQQEERALSTEDGVDSELWRKCIEEHGPDLRREFPMYVVPISKLLKMKELKTHEEVKSQLVEWKPGMGAVFFVSHTWLRWKAPDRDNVKIDLLKSILKRIVEGTMKDVRTHYMADAYFGGQVLKGASLTEALKDGYVWLVRAGLDPATSGCCTTHARTVPPTSAARSPRGRRAASPSAQDVMSIPQADPVAQGKAIRSIVSYVSDAAFFCVLAGAWKHENGSVRDVRGWHERGVCCA